MRKPWESDPNGIYTYCSSKCIDLFGYQTEELIGKTAFYLMPPEEALRVEVLFQNIFLAQCSFNRKRLFSPPRQTSPITLKA